MPPATEACGDLGRVEFVERVDRAIDAAPGQAIDDSPRLSVGRSLCERMSYRGARLTGINGFDSLGSDRDGMSEFLLP